ncbi:hypothetical protein A2U01_0036697, partial [Trifolium medium]|nr:hypothetical protein [Trifolium medium]
MKSFSRREDVSIVEWWSRHGYQAEVIIMLGCQWKPLLENCEDVVRQ